MKNYWLDKTLDIDIVEEIWFLRYHLNMTTSEAIRLPSYDRKFLIKSCQDAWRKI